MAASNSSDPQGERYSKYEAFLSDAKGQGYVTGAKAHLDVLESFDPQDVRSAKDISKAWRATSDRVRGSLMVDGKPVSISQAPSQTKRSLNAAIDHWLEDYRAAYNQGKVNVPYDDVAKEVHKLRLNVGDGKDKVVPTKYRPATYDQLGAERAKMQRQFDIQREATDGTAKHAIDRFAELAKYGGGGPGALGPEDSLATNSKLARRQKVQILERQIGLSRTAADKLVNLGLDPTKGPQTIDADKYGLNTQTVSKLVAAGYKIKGSDDLEVGESGYSRGELRSGRSLGSSSAAGQTRLLRKQGLLRSKTFYEDDGRGGVRPVTVAPKYTAGDVKDSVHRNTFGAIGSGVSKWRRAREEKQLNKPRNKILRTEGLLRNDRIDQLRGQAENSEGVKRSWYLLQLKIMRWTMTHKAVAIGLLGAALLFVPWFGVLTYTGYGIANVAMTFLEFVASVLVNIYNVLASAAISAVSFLGGTVSGTFEALTNLVLKGLHLDPIARNCQFIDGKSVCENARVFSFTPVGIDIDAKNLFPDVPKPAKFDDRLGLEIALEFFGIRWSIFNDIRHWFRGGT